SLQELRDAVLETQQRYNELHSRAGYLELAEHARMIQAEQERQHAQAQAEFAAMQEAEAKEEMHRRYLAAGGTSEQFTQAWPALWRQELARRVQAGTDLTTQRLYAS